MVWEYHDTQGAMLGRGTENYRNIGLDLREIRQSGVVMQDAGAMVNTTQK